MCEHRDIRKNRQQQYVVFGDITLWVLQLYQSQARWLDETVFRNFTAYSTDLANQLSARTYTGMFKIASALAILVACFQGASAMSWKTCGSTLLNPTSVTLAPDPPVIGEKVAFKIDGIYSGGEFVSMLLAIRGYGCHWICNVCVPLLWHVWYNGTDTFFECQILF